jgi:hypothetical protein
MVPPVTTATARPWSAEVAGRQQIQHAEMLCDRFGVEA